MNEQERIQFLHTWRSMKDSIEPNDLLTYLLQDEILTINEMELLKEASTRSSRVQRMLTYIYICSKPNTFSKLCNALENCGYEFICDQLKSKAILDTGEYTL